MCSGWAVGTFVEGKENTSVCLGRMEKSEAEGEYHYIMEFLWICFFSPRKCIQNFQTDKKEKL